MDFWDIYEAGLKNDRFWNNNQNLIGKIKIILFLLTTVALSKKSKPSSDTLAWMNGNRGHEKLFEDETNYYLVFHGSYFININRYKDYHSALSMNSFAERIGILIKGLSLSLHQRKKSEPLCYFLEFYFIFNMIVKCNPKKIITTDIYDRQSTWISCLAKKANIELEIFQHGVIGDLKIPQRIYATKVYAFDNNQIKLFKKNVIDKENCDYAIKPLKSVVEFKEYENKRGILIGIATQRNKRIVDKIISEVQRIDCEKTIILMIHPLESIEEYREYQNYNKIIIEKKKRYSNLDILIIQNSTIVYDYLGIGFKGTIFRIDSSQSINPLDEIKDIVKINNYSDIFQVTSEFCCNFVGKGVNL